MLVAIAVALLLAAVVLPQFWVRHTISRHSDDRPDLPGTGGELARHLLNRYDLPNVGVEITETGDHYDPEAKMVRLLPQHHDGRSLAAVAIATHEVSHALQDAGNERMLALRQRLARLVMVTDRMAGIVFLAAPILGVVLRAPAAIFGLVAIGVALLSVRVIINLVTLPVELDASFGKALPILKDGDYLDEKDLTPVRSVLRAAAFTYVASALISLINLARWIRLLR
jgi:Zn-dependent membrane protease YugP